MFELNPDFVKFADGFIMTEYYTSNSCGVNWLVVKFENGYVLRISLKGLQTILDYIKENPIEILPS